MKLKTRPLEANFGLEVLDLELATLDDEAGDALRELWQGNPLLLLRRQLLSEIELVDFSARFGKLEIIVRKDIHSVHHPEVVIVSNLRNEAGESIGGLGSYDLRWHTDQSYREKPATGAIFLAVEVPEQGGDTWWANTELAYDALPAGMRDELDHLEGMFKYILYEGDVKDDPKVKDIRELTPDAVHPMVLCHPVTGRKSLYLDVTQTYGIVDMEPARGEALLKELRAHVCRDEFCYRHSWRAGDVMMWDNSRLQHRRDPFDSKSDASQTLPPG